jgi:hypothetical protein
MNSVYVGICIVAPNPFPCATLLLALEQRTSGLGDGADWGVGGCRAETGTATKGLSRPAVSLTCRSFDPKRRRTFQTHIIDPAVMLIPEYC